MKTWTAWTSLTLVGAFSSLAMTGRVLEKAMQAPVPGATVQILGGGSVQTDSAGRFEINPAAAKPGWISAPLWVWHGQGFSLNSLADLHAVTLHIHSSGGAVLHRESVATLAAKASLPVPRAALQGQMIAFAQIRWQGGRRLFKLSRQGLSDAWNANLENRSAPASKALQTTLSKESATGSLLISKEKLVSRTVIFDEGQGDIGDIVLDYPSRVLDVGAKPPYGAEMLFDGSQGAAAAEKEMLAKWKPWWRFDTTYQNGGRRTPVTAIHFKIAKDPEFPNDANRVSMRSCCSVDNFWGYHDIQTVKSHGDVQLHVEWMGLGEYRDDDTENPNAEANCTDVSGSPCYYNSGVYVQSRYEVQILTGPLKDNHSVGSIVKEYLPSVNPMRANGQWQAYDITFRTARYRSGNTQGPGDTLALMSVWWNGVPTHINRKVNGAASGLANHSGEEMNALLHGLKLQNESGDVRFRNIWMKPLQIDSLGTYFGY